MAYTFKVEDMTCGGCVASVRKAVSRVAGVQSVEADLSSHQVVVEVSPDVSSDTIVAAINAAGYAEVTALGGA